MSSRPLRVLAVTACLGIAGSAPAHAHLVQTGFGRFYDGVAHLALTPPDVLVVIALALLAGLGGPAPARAALFTLPAAWLVGGLVGASLPGGGELAGATTLSFGLAGALVAVGVAPAAPWAAVLAGAAGFLHGYGNGASMAAGDGGVLGLVGAVATVFTASALLSAFVVSLRRPWSRIVVRVAGSWIAAVGLLMLGWLLRPGG